MLPTVCGPGWKLSEFQVLIMTDSLSPPVMLLQISKETSFQRGSAYFMKTIRIPSDAVPGQHFIYVRVSYGNQTAGVGESFYINAPEEWPKKWGLLGIVNDEFFQDILGMVVVVLIISIIVFKRLKQANRVKK